MQTPSRFAPLLSTFLRHPALLGGLSAALLAPLICWWRFGLDLNRFDLNAFMWWSALFSVFFGLIGLMMGGFFQTLFNLAGRTTIGGVFAVLCCGVLSHLLAGYTDGGQRGWSWPWLIFFWMVWAGLGVASKGVPRRDWRAEWSELLRQPAAVLVRKALKVCALYVALFLLFFDLTPGIRLSDTQPSPLSPSYVRHPGDSCGPRPHDTPLAYSRPDGYSGHEPLFLVFAPLCRLWVWVHGPHWPC